MFGLPLYVQVRRKLEGDGEKQERETEIENNKKVGGMIGTWAHRKMEAGRMINGNEMQEDLQCEGHLVGFAHPLPRHQRVWTAVSESHLHLKMI